MFQNERKIQNQNYNQEVPCSKHVCPFSLILNNIPFKQSLASNKLIVPKFSKLRPILPHV